MKVVLVYAPAARCCHEEVLNLPDGLDAWSALQTAGWVERFPELTDDRVSLSVWGRQVTRKHRLREGDRLEICRPLRVDPKVARRERFVAQGARGSGLFASRRSGSKAGY